MVMKMTLQQQRRQRQQSSLAQSSSLCYNIMRRRRILLLLWLATNMMLVTNGLPQVGASSSSMEQQHEQQHSYFTEQENRRIETTTTMRRISDSSSSSCEPPPQIVRLDQTKYTLTGLKRHPPLMNYLTKWVNNNHQQSSSSSSSSSRIIFDPPLEFEALWDARKWMNQPTPHDALRQGIDFSLDNPYRATCTESEANAVTLAVQVRPYAVRRDENTSNSQPLIYNMSQYGAVLYTLANRTDITSVQDVQGKRLATNQLTNLATHLCFDVLLRNGVHFLQDPRQVLFTRNSDKALQAVLDGKADVGCAATGHLESFVVRQDETTGESTLLDLERDIRILDPQQHVVPHMHSNDGGTIPFPHKISTPLVPQFLFQALPHVDARVVQAVQAQLLQLQPLHDYAPSLLACLDARAGCVGSQVIGKQGIGAPLPYEYANNTACIAECWQELLQREDPQQQEPLSCAAILTDDEFGNGTVSSSILSTTTPEQVLDAFDVLQRVEIVGFTTPIRNLVMRDIEEKTGFLIKDYTSRRYASQLQSNSVLQGNFANQSLAQPQNGFCVRFRDIVDAVACPPGHFARTSKEIFEQCNVSGLTCDVALDCICDPCVKASEVEFFTTSMTHHEDPQDSLVLAGGQEGSHAENRSVEGFLGLGCSKFAACGHVAQQHRLRLQAVDNRLRSNAIVTGLMLGHDDDEDADYRFTFNKAKLNTSREDGIGGVQNFYYCDYFANKTRTGPKIIQIFINGEEIPESPFRLSVTQRDCAADYPDQARLVPDVWGNCACESGSVDLPILGVSCVPVASTLIPCIFGPLIFVCGVLTLAYMRYKRTQEDAIWRVDLTELQFDGKPQILGRGHFGLVFLAEFRGTQVAVKSVLPPHLSEDSLSIFSTTDQEGSRPSRKTKSTSGGRRNRAGAPDRDKIVSLSGSLLEFENQLNNKGDPQEPFYVVEEDENAPSRGAISSFGVETISGDDLAFSLSHFLSWSHRPTRSVTSWSKKVKRRRHVRQLNKNFVQEMRLLSKLRHPCITTVMGAVISNRGKRCDPMMVMEYMHFGSLFDLLHNESMILEMDVLVHMLKDVASGLRFLHSSKPQVVHGDLKSQNILVDEKFRAKVADFGLSENKGFFRETKACGTPFWMAPELLRGESRNTPESDVYSFGVVLFEAFSRQEPYVGERGEDVLRRVASKAINKRPDVPSNCPADAAALMMCCWEGDPAERPTASELDIQLRIMDSGHAGNVAPSTPETTPRQQRKQDISGRGDMLLDKSFPPHIARALRQGGKVEPEAHDEVTIIFAEIVGYSELASTMSPTKVSDLLDRLYTELDSLCESLSLFKVDTIGDAYMAVTNLRVKQPNHTCLAAQFAVEATLLSSHIPIDVDEISKGMVQIRCGIHTGPVVTHVVGARNPRYSLIGDTVNTAARMESHSMPGKIQCSEATYMHLCPMGTNDEGDLPFNVTRRGKIHVKGKGDMVTYWIHPSLVQRKDFGRGSTTSTSSDCQERRLIGWSVDTLELFASQVVKFHDDNILLSDTESLSHEDLVISLDDDVELTAQSTLQVGSVVERTRQIIPFPASSGPAKDKEDDEKLKEKKSPLDFSLRKELEYLLTMIYHMYKEHSYHNFEHATHALLSSVKLLNKLPPSNPLSSDPVARWAVVFATLVHDLDHPGVDNFSLVNDYASLARTYEGRSVAEQNSIDTAWSLFTDSRFDTLREALCPNANQLNRFHQLLVKAVLATDVADTELQSIRRSNWEKAFAEESEDHQCLQANAALEMIMQAADLSYTMQPWTIYVKWSRRLQQEALVAFRAGRYDQDPSTGWFEDALSFLEDVILPLAKHLEDAGLPALYTTCATDNRAQWLEKGQGMVEETAKQLGGAEELTIEFA